MALDARKRRELVAAANRIKISATVSADSIGDGAIEHVRRCFAKQELIKVRISTSDRREFESATVRIAELTPCDLVQKLGRVATLYRPHETAEEQIVSDEGGHESGPQP